MIRQARVGLALRHDSFEIVLACEPEQHLTISFDVVAIQETFAGLRHGGIKPQLAINQWQITEVFTVSKSALLVLII
jgi:hypothetical protein